ncbi:hypothetical protein [Thermogemmata fonticola]|uniref:Uncharacterized protein n=1 Tax=Thermogemmata fonticola TaxID=2755323 RepID=A0A7V8VEU8_9BACT|nr:hypothetical protein [Thermogemmata fonticola]MBA2226730.1 hypothetical protein [Thermogemmata fonticola]
MCGKADGGGCCGVRTGERFRHCAARVLRSWLDPEGGPEETRLALPPDPDLARDLLAVRYALRAQGITVESKDDLRKRLGRSPDAGDAVALACWVPPRAALVML